jgi:peptidoglycan/LPS O-acetylase OafA/YrhL
MKLSLFHNVQAGNITKSTWWFTEAWTFRPELLSMLKESFFGVFVLDECNYNPVLWTMRYEFFGSFLVFFLAAAIGRYKHRNIIYFFLCCLLFQTYYLAFVAGLILCDLTFNGYLEVFGKVIPKLVLLGLFLGSYPAGMEVTNTIYYLFEIRVINNNPLLFHILGSVCIMLGIINSKRLQHFFSIKILQFLGRISFPMYLVHLTLIGTFSCFLFVKLTRYLDYNVAFIVTFLLSLLLIFGFSAIINKYIDEKGILLTHKMYKFIKNKLQKAS